MASKLIQVTGELFAYAENAAEQAGVAVDYQIELWARVGRSYVGTDHDHMVTTIIDDHQLMNSMDHDTPH